MTNRCARMRVRGYIRILILSILSFLLTPAECRGYADVIVDRWEKFTGKKAVLLHD